MEKVFQSVGSVQFPEPADRDINMMPFIIGQKDSLPAELLEYWPLIESCDIESEEVGRVGYLTVTEREVQPGQSQRRGGVHVERHVNGNWGKGGWGHGKYGERRQGGLYMASNCPQTTALWQNQVKEPGPGGDCQHLDLGAPDKILDAGELVWMTDSCPHASLPITKASYRQFFRLVTSAVDLWYQEHSTANPLGIELPDNVKVISENKFA